MVSGDPRPDRRAARRQCSSFQRHFGSVVPANGHETTLALSHETTISGWARGRHQRVLARRHRARGRITAAGYSQSEILQAGDCLHDVRAMEPAGLGPVRVDKPILALPVQLAFVADGEDHGTRHWHLHGLVCRRLPRQVLGIRLDNAARTAHHCELRSRAPPDSSHQPSPQPDDGCAERVGQS